MPVGAPTQAPWGWQSSDSKELFTVRGRDWSRGEIGKMDLANTDAAVSSNAVGAQASGLANLITPTTNKCGQMLALLLQDIDDDQAGYAITYGEADAIVKKNTGDVTPETPLYLCSSARYTLTADGATGDAQVAIALETIAAPGTTGALGRILFSGIKPFGVKT